MESKVKWLSVILLLFLGGLLGGCTGTDGPQPDLEERSDQAGEALPPSSAFKEGEERAEEDLITDEQLASGEDEQQEKKELRMMVVGDIMMHMPQIEAGFTGEKYDFSPFFEEVAPLFKEADLVMGNLETTFGGPERGYSGYPLFSAPDALAHALKDAGFDVITTANNHSLDTGEKGLLRTIDQLEAVGLLRTGTFRSQEERDTILTVTKNGITIAILAYTYGTNGIPIPDGKEYLVNLLDQSLIKADIEQAKKKADFVSVAIHFGAEYQVEPNEEQRRWVDQLFDWGADLIFGSHPHVLQPLEHRTWENEEERGEGLVIFSLGNFISNQRDEPRDIGGILDITLTKTESERSINSVNFIPTYVHRYELEGRRHYQVIPMNRLLELRTYPALSEADYDVLAERYQKMMDHVVPVHMMAEEEGFEPSRRQTTP